MRRGLIVVLWVFGAMFSLEAITADKKSGAEYHASINAMADVDTALRTARREEKLAFVALGANWCHDSRGLATKLKAPGIKAIMADSYVPVLVNVGYYDAGLDVAKRFGRPTIFSTPTVLIVDPETGKQVNADTMHRWSRSAAMTEAEMATYLTNIAEEAATDAPALSQAQRDAYARIADFESRVAARVIKGFAVVGPLLAAEDKGEDVDINSVWYPLAKLRNKLMKDVTALRQQVRTNKGNEPLDLTFPTYEPLPWEEAN